VVSLISPASISLLQLDLLSGHSFRHAEAAKSKIQIN
jgi:hypothetical protein